MHENKEKITKAQKEGKNSPLKKIYMHDKQRKRTPSNYVTCIWLDSYPQHGDFLLTCIFKLHHCC